jgi:hypothetical protein
MVFLAVAGVARLISSEWVKHHPWRPWSWRSPIAAREAWTEPEPAHAARRPGQPVRPLARKVLG